MADTDSPEPIAELVGHMIDIHIYCACTTLPVAQPAYFLELMGPDVTIAEAERRMICKHCRERPRLVLSRQWAISGGRDRRPNPPPIPAWAKLRLDGGYTSVAPTLS